MLRLTDHVWEIYQISRQNKVSINISGIDMFIANLELGYDRYKGASNIDYSELGKEWAKIPKLSQDKRKLQLKNFISRYSTSLSKAWLADDRETFDSIIKEILERRPE